MIKLSKTRIMKSLHRAVTPGYNVDQEGLALVYVVSNGEGTVQPSSGAAGEHFAGVAWSQAQLPTQLSYVDIVQVNGNTTFNTNFKPLVAGQISIKGLALANAASAGYFAVNYATGEVTIDAADAGTASAPKTLNVVYKFVPTVQQALLAQGNVIGGSGITGASWTGITGIITEGDVSTDYFDAACDWSVQGPIYLGPNGLFTLTAGGTELKGANVIEAPSQTIPYLTLNFGPPSF